MSYFLSEMRKKRVGGGGGHRLCFGDKISDRPP